MRMKVKDEKIEGKGSNDRDDDLRFEVWLPTVCSNLVRERSRGKLAQGG